MLDNLFVNKEATIEPSTTNIYGRYSIFDPCAPGDIFGLQVQTRGLQQWLGFRPNKFYRRRVDFITWIGAEGSEAGRPTSGAGSPCADPNGWEYGQCGYDLTHSAWYHRTGKGLDPHTIVQERCETSPRYRLNGVQINDDVEWQMNGVMNVLSQDISYGLIHGSHNNAYEMDGLESIIKTGYTDREGRPCSFLDSILVDWNNDDLDGSNNGYGNIFNYLDEVVTEVEYRSSSIGTIGEPDMVILTSRFMATCLLDAYACYTTCGVTSNNDITDQALRAQQRQARMQLNGGALYDGRTAVGYLPLKSGRRLAILVDDAIEVGSNSGNYCSDLYMLTRRIGSMDVLYGEYLDLRVYENRVRNQFAGFGARADQAGRFAVKGKEDNWCVQLMMGTSPEIYLGAPWAQMRLQNLCCSRSRKPVVGDPHQPDYMPGYMYQAQAYS